MYMDKTILVIAGSDSCAGAGMQIDIKTASAHGVHATCAVTALTAQNTCGVSAIDAADAEMVRAQIDMVFADMAPDAIKIGMLGCADVAFAVAERLTQYSEVPVVLDPVLVATAGATLTEASVFELVRDTLVGRATLITPNIPEAAQLSGIEIRDAASMNAAAAEIFAHGAHAVLIKGGHADGDILVDRLYMGDDVHEFASRRLPGVYHGTGCSLSTAIASNLACGMPLVEAVSCGHDFIARALERPLSLGNGTRVFDPLRASTVWTRSGQAGA